MDALQRLDSELAQIRADGLYKTERVIASPQSAEIVLAVPLVSAAMDTVTEVGRDRAG
mgnify:CR=1 FL=1